MSNKFGLIGTNISHSKSPLLFKAAYNKYPFSYTLLDYPLFSSAIKKIKEMGITGVNVTTPFKDEAYLSAHKRDQLCEEIEASNLLIFKDGHIMAYNTDYYGVKNTLAAYTDSNIKTLIIGCGGAGRAAALAARDLNHKVSIANRTIDKAKKYALKIGVTAISIPQAASDLNKFDVIIDTLSESVSVLNFTHLTGKTLLKASYPHSFNDNTLIANNTCFSGEHWLINQAIPSYKLFTGIDPDIKAMRLIISI